MSVKSWFNTPERIAALEFKAGKWIGTPFFANSCTPGARGGVSCQKLMEAIYREAGFCDVKTPEVPMSLARFAREGEGLLEPWLEACPYFEKVGMGTKGIMGVIQIGDLITFRFGKIAHHGAIVLTLAPTPGFIHAMSGHRVMVSWLSDGMWASRLSTAWRPLLRQEHFGGQAL